MSKIISIRYSGFFILVGFGLLFLAGCDEFAAKQKFHEMKVPEQKLREIETLDLSDMAAEEKPPVEADVSPPAEFRLTLEQCRALTLENNLDLKAELISPAIAAKAVSEQEAAFEAAFFSNLYYSRTNTPVASFLDDLTGSKVDYTNIDLGVQVPLQTGGTVTFDVADRRTESNAEYSVFNPYYGSELSLSISQPLLRNAGRRASTYAIRLARYEHRIIDARTKLEVIRAIAAADRAYWRLYAARKDLEVRKKEYDLAEAQLEKAKRFVESGEMAQVEVVRAEAGVAERLEAIIVTENNLRDRQRELKLTMNKPGLEMRTPTVLIPATAPDPVHYDLDSRRLVEAAVENRMEMLELELQIAEDVSRIDYYRNQALPLVTFDYTYGVNGLGATRSESFDLLRNREFEDHIFGLNLLVPLGNQAAKSRLYQALYQRIQRLATRKSRQAAIEQEVLNALDRLEANWQRILASRQNAVLAGRLFEAELRQFELGLRTSTDVLDAQTKFADAQSAEILALTEYQIAQVDLAYATGTLLGAAKVRWEPIIPETVSD